MFKQKLIILTFLTLLFSACAPSNEEKAQKMASDYLKGVLYRFDSYEPLKTTVDSAFVSLSSDPESIQDMGDMSKLFKSLQEYSEAMSRAERSMDLYSPGFFSTPYDKGEYRRAKEERDNNQQALERTVERINSLFAKIKDRQKHLNIGEYDGWKVYHMFKSLNGAGTLNLTGEYIFFCDTEFNEKLAYTKEDYDSLVIIMDAVSESDEIDEFIEKVQNMVY